MNMSLSRRVAWVLLFLIRLYHTSYLTLFSRVFCCALHKQVLIEMVLDSADMKRSDIRQVTFLSPNF